MWEILSQWKRVVRVYLGKHFPPARMALPADPL